MWRIFTEKTVQWHNHGVISNPLPPLPCVKMHSTADLKSAALVEVISITDDYKWPAEHEFLSTPPFTGLKELYKGKYVPRKANGPIKIHLSKKVLIKHSIRVIYHAVLYHTSIGSDAKNK